MDRLPKILGFGEIERVTYSLWVHLNQCTLKAAIGTLKLDAFIPESVPTRAGLIGAFHHRLMELATNARSASGLTGEIDHEIALLQASVDRWAHLKRIGSVSGWDEVNRSAALAVRVFSRSAAQNVTRMKRAELELSSKDGRLFGRPDFVSIEARHASLREYKSGSIRDADGQPVRSYIDQLRFYSHLVLENFDVARVVCHLESLSGDVQEVVVEPQEANAFASAVREMAERANAKIAAARAVEDLASPSNDACSGCIARIVCGRFKSNQDGLGLEGAQFVLEGVVKSIIVRAGHVTAEVRIEGEGRHAVHMLSLPVQECSELVVEAPYVFMDLRRHGGKLAWDHGSRVLRRD